MGEVQKDTEQAVDRRQFLGIITGAIGAVISFALGIPAVAYVIGPALQQQDTEEWIQVGPTSKIEPSIPTLFKARVERQTGWIVNQEEISVYVLTEDGREYQAMSNICTHLGCRVRWISDQEQFFCPCHNAAFEKDGRVASGPPPRPLDRFEVKVENDQIWIRGG